MTMKKFNKTLTFDRSYSSSESNNSSHQSTSNGGGRQRLSVTRLTAKMNNNERAQYSNGQQLQQQRMQPLDNKEHIDYATNGLTGLFVPIKNDFSVLNIGQAADNNYTDDEDDEHSPDCIERYRDEPHWTHEAKKKVKRVRFVICILALLGLALGLMSRLMLNVSIVEMVRKPDIVPGEDLIHELSTTTTTITTTTTTTLAPRDELLFAADEDIHEPARSFPPEDVPQQPPPILFDNQPDSSPVVANEPTTAATTLPPNDTTDASQVEMNASHDDGLHFSWSKQEVNIVLASFYLGYGPGILFSGSVAEKYGAKYPMFACIFGSAIINLFTPLIARYSLYLLIASRITLGLIQGSLLPCLYELFNRWLTQTESSIFAPMIKVSMPLGSLMGTVMPGLCAKLKLDWPNLFYIGGFLCLVWSLVWALIATSLPQTNRFVGINELNRIMRKKKNHLNQPATITEKAPRPSLSHSDTADRSNRANQPAKSSGTPWMLIITSPSVLALTIVKFTYNIGMDFIFLQLAVYLREVHNAPIETISTIAGSGYCMQMVLISFVGWLAKVVIIKRACGLSVTKWRKIFQGSSNFIMALAYVTLAYSYPSLEMATVLIMVVCFWWMMGAGGESMLPYDLSSEYPASIVGFAHSFSIYSGLALPAICDIVIGEHTDDPQRWSMLFYILSGMLAGGGLIFVIIVKARPFLPGEKIPKAIRHARKQQQQQQQQVTSISMARDHTGSNKLSNFR
uniref:Putative transporter C38C10.2 n=1 Tax=Aceria tosichella TaxID=561515 RepID=A0A6G1S3M7_9ACAR